AGRMAELEKQVATRQGSPTDVAGGRVLLLQLAAMQQEREKAKQQLEAIGQQLEASKLGALTGLATHAAAAALADEQLAAAAVPLLEKIIGTPPQLGRSISFGAPGPHSAATVLVRQHLRAGNFED